MSDIKAEPELEQLYRRLETLIFAGGDMFDVFETSRYLLGQHPDAAAHDGGMPWHVRRTLETGLFITYARPFVEARGRRSLKQLRGLSDELRAFHDDIVNRRNQVYAHIDRTPLRRILQLRDPEERTAWVQKRGELREEWFPPTRKGLEILIELARAHLQTFLDAIDTVGTRILKMERSETQQTS
jgi:hypothetical protein